MPVTVLWRQEFESIADALWWEKRIQNWSRAKREALMRGDCAALRRASKKTFPKADESPLFEQPAQRASRDPPAPEA